jgi:histidine triad (HIT) family protein
VSSRNDSEHALGQHRSSSTPCVFCEIAAGRSPASIIFEDDSVAAFMTLRPTAPGECLVIPKAHVDHFTDIPDDIAQRIMVVAQRIGRRMRSAFPLDRVGFLVHGYGVAHAHLIIMPQQGPHHLTSGRFARIVDGRVAFDMSGIPVADRATLDEYARRLASDH